MLKMISIPGGRVRVGSTVSEVQRCVSEWSEKLLDSRYSESQFRSWIEKEYPAHTVELLPYAIAKYPVTNGEYRHYCDRKGARIPESLTLNWGDDHPVWGVSHLEANLYASWISDQSGEKYRLPTEAEWENAARGVNDYEYSYGCEFSSLKANTHESRIGRTTPVSFYDAYASGYGVSDLSGNVEEWVSDLYRPYPDGQWINDDLVDALGKAYYVLRGGSFARGGDLSRTARRHGQYPSSEFRFTGFRLARSFESK